MAIPKTIRERIQDGAARRAARTAMMRAGTRMSATSLANARVMLGYLELGATYGTPPQFSDREQLFELAVDRSADQTRPLYLEFGVWRGASLRWWSAHLRQPDARLFGFDSFEGLPDDWRPEHGEGAFRVNGPPQIDDPRVAFEIGWFDKTLAEFTAPAHDRLILNIDCDVYSSTCTVLEWAEPLIKPGTLIYYDELPDHDHELRAMNEHLARTGAALEPLGTAAGGLQWLFQYR